MATARQLPTLEYRLFITPRFDEREQRYKTVFQLETIQLFSTFRYDISVRVEQVDRAITFIILGLKAPQLSLPASGHAQFTREYSGLRGTYDISVEGLDGRTNTFSVRISPKHVSLLKAPSKKFVDVVVDKSQWTSQ